MNLRKIVENGYIVAVGRGKTGLPISAEEYDEICAALRRKPPRTSTTDYRLRDDMTWEPYEVEAVQEPEPCPEELLNILIGEGET